MAETLLSNARLVLPDRVIRGAVLIRDGRIAAIDERSANGEDLEGDYLIPGLVEAVGLIDRGAIGIGRRADLVQVRLDRHVPVVRTVWREGRRVA